MSQKPVTHTAVVATAMYVLLMILAGIWGYFLFYGLHLMENPTVYPEYASHPEMRSSIIKALQGLSFIICGILFPTLCIESATSPKRGYLNWFSARNIFFVVLTGIIISFSWSITTNYGLSKFVFIRLFHNTLGVTCVIPSFFSLAIGISMYFMVWSVVPNSKKEYMHF